MDGDAAADDNGFSTAEAVHLLRNRLPALPDIVVVLGSGLSRLADAVEDPVEVPFAEVPGYPDAGVAGHDGRYVFGLVEGRRVLVQAGRFHFYEGHPASVVAAPIRVAAGVEATTLVVTNAAGAVDGRLEPGDLLLLDDQLDVQGRSVLAGPLEPGEERFPDMSAPYDPDLQAVALAAARARGFRLARGTYAAVLGPSYETPAEIRMLRRLGVHAVGMSTVPEVTVARALGLKVLGFSLITNPALDREGEALSHDEVVAAARRATGTLERLLRGVIPDLPGWWGGRSG